MKITFNYPAVIAHRNFKKINDLIAKSVEKITSGYRINSAADDAAGLAISERLRMQISALEQASYNAQSGISISQTADSALSTIETLIRRINDLTTLAANGDKTDTDRAIYNDEVQVILAEIDRIASATEYNGIKLINGNIGGTATEAGDINNINKESGLTVSGEIKSTGEYQVEVLRPAGRATGYLQGATGTFDTTSSLYDFLGATTDDTNIVIKINDNVVVTGDVKVSGGDTVGDFINKINNALSENNVDITAAFSADIQPGAAGSQAGIVFTYQKYGSKYDFDVEIIQDTTGGSAQAISSSPTITGTVVANDSDADANAYDDLDISLGDIKITLKDSTITSTITVNAGDTLNDIINNIETDVNLAGKIDVTLDTTNGRLIVTDLSGGNGNLKIEDVGSNFTATDLGIAGTTSTSTITGVRLSRTRDYVLQVTDPDSNTAILRGNYKDASTYFEAISADSAIISSGEEVNNEISEGGIAGINFMLEESALVAGQKFSIIAQAGNITFQVGSTSGSSGRLTVDIGDMRTSALGIADIDISTQSQAQSLIDNGTIEDALNKVLRQRGKIGAYQNRLNETVELIENTRINMMNADSAIRDTDLALEYMNFSKYSILQQSSAAMLAQANILPNVILNLINYP